MCSALPALWKSLKAYRDSSATSCQRGTDGGCHFGESRGIAVLRNAQYERLAFSTILRRASQEEMWADWTSFGGGEGGSGATYQEMADPIGLPVTSGIVEAKSERDLWSGVIRREMCENTPKTSARPVTLGYSRPYLGGSRRWIVPTELLTVPRGSLGIEQRLPQAPYG